MDKNLTPEEKDAIIEIELKKGTSYKTIVDMTGVPKNYITELKNRLIEEGKLTQEEIDAAKQQEKENEQNRIDAIVKVELLAGTDYEMIAEKIGKPGKKRLVTESKKRLLAKGELTTADLENVRQAMRREKIVTDEKNIEILEYLNMGVPQTHIAEYMQLHPDTITDRVKTLLEVKAISKEEIQQARNRYNEEQKQDSLAREIVLKGLKNGDTKVDISHDLDITAAQVRTIQKGLMQDRKITKKQIEKASVTKGKMAKKHKVVMALLQDGYDYDEIREKVDYSKNTITKIKKEAIEKGILTEEEYKLAKKNRKKLTSKSAVKTAENVQENLLDAKKQVLEMLQEGRRKRTICQKLQIAAGSYEQIENQLLEENAITQKQIDENRTKKDQEIEQNIIQDLRMGYSIPKCIALHPEDCLTRNLINHYINHLVQLGILTKEQIDVWRKEEIQRRENIVLEGLKAGYTRHKIADLDELKQLDVSKIGNIVKRFKKIGIITQEEIDDYREKRQKAEQEKALPQKLEEEKRILHLLKGGFYHKEIGEKLGGMSARTISKKVCRLKKKGKIRTDTINHARRKRTQADKEKTLKQIEEEAFIYEKYKKKAEEIVLMKYENVPEETVDQFLSDFIGILETRMLRGFLKKEELKILHQTMYMGSFQMKNITKIAKLHAGLQDFKGAYFFLNDMRRFFDDEGENPILKKAIDASRMAIKKQEQKKDYMR